MPETPQIILRIDSGPNAGGLFAVTDNAFIGTGANCDICLPDSGLDSIHARIGVRGSIFTITDLTEQADITVNGNKIKSRRLAIGDIVDIAGMKISVLAEAEASVDEVESVATGGFGSGIDSGEVLVMGTEDSPLTEITLVQTEDVEEYIEDDVAEEEPEPVSSQPVQPARSAMDERRRAQMQNRELQKAKIAQEKSKAPVVLIVLALVALVGIGAVLMSSRAEKRALAAKYMAVAEFAVANKADPQAVIIKYKEFLQHLGTGNPGLRTEVNSEIVRIEGEMSANQKELQDLLTALDERAEDLISDDKFDEASEVYTGTNSKRRSEIVELRKSKLASIEVLKEKYLVRMAAAKKAADAQRELMQRKHLRESLELLADDVADKLLDGETKSAMARLEVALEQETFADAKGTLESVLAMVRVLEARQTLLESGEEEKDLSPEDLDGLSPVVCTILQMRSGNLLAARSASNKIQGHFLEAPLKRRILDSGDILAAEKKVMVKFLHVWRKISGDTGNRIPKPEVCVGVMEAKFAEESSDTVTDLVTSLLKSREGHGFTEFVRLYSSVFDYAESINAGRPTFVGSAGNDDIIAAKSDGAKISRPMGKAIVFDPGNGKVSQVQDKLCFVDSTADVDAMKDGVVGIFELKESFYAIDGSMKPLGALVEISDVYPFSVLGLMQVTFKSSDAAVMPQIGQSVLVGAGVEKGIQFIELMTGASSGRAIFDDFSGEDLDKRWVSRAGSDLQKKDGMLVFRRDGASHKGKRSASAKGQVAGDFEYSVDIGDGDVSVEFDLVRRNANGISVALGNTAFVIGTDGQHSEGIYLQGGLAVPGELAGEDYGEVEHVKIERVAGNVIINVNDNILSCRIQKSDIGAIGDKIRFWGAGETRIDNFRFDVSSIGSLGRARVVGLSAQGEVALVHAGGDSTWKTISSGHTVYFYELDQSGVSVPLAEGKIKVKTGDIYICELEEGKSLAGACLVSAGSSLKQAVSQSSLKVGDPVQQKRMISDAVVFARSNVDVGPGLVLDLPVNLPEQGYMYKLSDIYRHPVSGEVLAVSVETGGKRQFTQSRTSVICDPIPDEETVVSGSILKPGAVVDVKGLEINAYRQYTKTILQKGMWSADEKLWRIADGRLAADYRKDGTCPTLASSESFIGNFQCDINVRIDEPSKNAVDPKRSWAKDIMVEVYSPANMGGISFALGGEDNNASGLWIGGRTLSGMNIDDRLTGNMSLSEGVSVNVGEAWSKGVPALVTGEHYNLRLRRVGNVIALYLNGKRLAAVKCPSIKGDAVVLIGSPRRNVSVGAAVIRNISSSSKQIMRENGAGDFGYVLGVNGRKVLIDADMVGAASQETVSLMAVKAVSTGKDKEAIVLSKLATGIISEVRDRTATVLLSAPNELVEPGVKVIVGEMPDSHVVTSDWIRDISLPL